METRKRDILMIFHRFCFIILHIYSYFCGDIIHVVECRNKHNALQYPQRRTYVVGPRCFFAHNPVFICKTHLADAVLIICVL